MSDDTTEASRIEAHTDGRNRGHRSFETQELLDAVDAIDRLRDFLNDDPKGGPPQLRTDLLRLHQRAMGVVSCQVERSQREDFFDDAVGIADQVGEMSELIGRVEMTLHRLTDLSPDLDAD